MGVHCTISYLRSLCGSPCIQHQSGATGSHTLDLGHPPPCGFVKDDKGVSKLCKMLVNHMNSNALKVA